MRLPRVPKPHWTRDVPFWTIPGTDRQLLADIWEPAAGVERTGTAVVYLYGSWHFFHKDVLTRPLFRQLTALGHVVMDVAHRSCPETDVFGIVGDGHRAVACDRSPVVGPPVVGVVRGLWWSRWQRIRQG